MNKEEIQEFITKLEASNSRDRIVFLINQYGTGEIEHYIKANPDGLQLFAVELLRASLQINEVSINEKKIIPFEDWEIWSKGDIGVQYIKPTLNIDKPLQSEDSPNYTWKERLVKYGCIFLALFLLASLITGLTTILGWIF